MAYDEILVARLRAAIGNLPGMVEKKMFGGIGFILNGNMALGILEADLLVRVSPGEYEAALQQPFAGVMDTFGRKMKGWVQVAPPGWAEAADLQRWVQTGLAAARALPPK